MRHNDAEYQACSIPLPRTLSRPTMEVGAGGPDRAHPDGNFR